MVGAVTAPSVFRASVAHAEDLVSLIEEYYEAVSVVLRDSPDEILANYVRNRKAGAWIAYVGTGAVGCVLYRPLPSMGAAGEVKRMYVRPPFRRRGVAQALLDRLERFAASEDVEWVYLDTVEEARAAVGFYGRNGYVRCPRYNDNPQATVFMCKRLVGSR
jgi:GNAT superfamily N-acetyltransferase